MRTLTRARRVSGSLRPCFHDQSVRVSFVDESINPRPIPVELVGRRAARLQVARGALRIGHRLGGAMQAALGNAAISFCFSELPLCVFVFAAT